MESSHPPIPFDQQRLVALFFLYPRSLREAYDLRALIRTRVPVPTTSIHSKTDGIVHRQSCLEAEGPEREKIEVECSHTGMGFHAEVLAVVADRLDQRDGSCQRYAKRG
jgi:hypothetical protein